LFYDILFTIFVEMKKQELVLKWLNKEFGDLTPAVVGDKTFYVDENRKPLFYYYQDSKNGYAYMNYERIWVFFESIFGLNTLQTKEILTIWLEETYNLRGVTPLTDKVNQSYVLEETYNLRGVTPITTIFKDKIDSWRRPII
jgi:hypothetical protein